MSKRTKRELEAELAELRARVAQQDATILRLLQTPPAPTVVPMPYPMPLAPAPIWPSPWRVTSPWAPLPTWPAPQPDRWEIVCGGSTAAPPVRPDLVYHPTGLPTVAGTSVAPLTFDDGVRAGTTVQWGHGVQPNLAGAMAMQPDFASMGCASSAWH